jgi:hypothetical protein
MILCRIKGLNHLRNLPTANSTQANPVKKENGRQR